MRRNEGSVVIAAIIVCMGALPLLSIPTQAQECLPAPGGIVGWWPGDGTTDDIENGNTGTMPWGEEFGVGLVDQAFDLDGIDDYVLVPSSSTIDSTTGFGAQLTIDAWIQPGGTDAKADNGLNDQIVRKGNATNDLGFSYTLRLGPDEGGVNKVWVHYCTSGATYCGGGSTERFQVKSDTTISDTDWHHIAAVIDTTKTAASSNIRIFIDGVESTHTTTTGSPQTGINSTPATSIGIGATAEGTAPFFGLLDEVQIFNRALEPFEIQAIFDAGAAGKCKDEDGDGFRPPEDCDESDPSVNPAGLELPGNFVDENCDGDLGDCDPCLDWRNHGKYVRCVAHAVNDLVDAAILTEEEGDALVSSAAQSSIGKQGYVPPECQ